MESRWEINATLRGRGFTPFGPQPDRYIGRITVGHLSIEIVVNVVDLDFVQLPKVSITNQSELPLDVIAHVEQGDGVCYAESSLLRLDRYNPGGSILRVLEEVRRTIGTSLKGGALNEIAFEYTEYWKGTRTYVLLPHREKHDKATFIRRAASTDMKRPMLLPSRHSLASNGVGKVVCYIIESSENITGMPEISVPKNLAEFFDWCNGQATPIALNANKVLSCLAQGGQVWIHAPNAWVGFDIKPDGLIGILMKKKGTRLSFLTRQISQDESSIKMEKARGSIADIEHVTQRNTGIDLHKKSVTLIGCGSIGGYLARLLVQAGLGISEPLTMVDHEVLAPGNLGRHALGFNSLGAPKATAVAEELRRFHPDVLAEPLDESIEDVFGRIRNSDLIIDATGVECVSEYLNAKAIDLRANGKTLNLLHVWTFGDGIAVQSFLNCGGEFACYRCLRPDIAKPWRFDPRKDTKSEPAIIQGACGDGAHVRYSAAAPTIAAALALDASIHFLSNQVGHRMRTRTVCYERARKTDDQSPSRSKTCPACAKSES